MSFRKLILSIVGALVSLVLVAVPTLAHETHTVKRGDTLSEIAQQHGTSWPKLFKLNTAIIDDPDLIYPGQVLSLESKKKSEPKKDSGKKTKPSRSDQRSGDKASQPSVGEDKASKTQTTQPATGGITSHYGMRTHPVTGVYKLHTGTDYAYGDGLAYAVRNGTVSSVEWNDAYGNLVTVNHGGGVQARYAHLAEVRVSTGQKVQAGTIVGIIGSTGYSTGPHLHFEVLKDGEFINPESWL